MVKCIKSNTSITVFCVWNGEMNAKEEGKNYLIKKKTNVEGQLQKLSMLPNHTFRIAIPALYFKVGG